MCMFNFSIESLIGFHKGENTILPVNLNALKKSAKTKYKPDYGPLFYLQILTSHFLHHV